MVAILDRIVSSDSVRALLMAPAARLARLEGWPPYERLRDASVDTVDMDTRTSLEALGAGDPEAVRWDDRLPSFDARLVWSDNLPEILDRHPGAILSGSFFWHEAVAGTGTVNGYVERARALIEEHDPVMVGNRYFATEAVRKLPRFHPVGLYRFVSVEPGSEKNGLLIDPGSSSVLEADAQELTDQLARRDDPPPGFATVWVRKSLMPSSAPAWMRPATYDDAMFGSIAVGIVRPGLGVLSDLLCSGADIVAIVEPSDPEMVNNAGVLADRGWGVSCQDFASGVDEAVRLCADPLGDRRRQERIGALDTDGIEESADVLRRALATEAG